MGKEKVIEDKIWEQIREKIENVKYGSVMIQIHDGKIVQVETNTKIRF